MKKFVYKFCAITFMFFLILASLFRVGNNDNFYMKQYIKNNTINYTGMEMTDLLRATDLLQDYLNDNIDHLDMTVEKWGDEKELFDSREKTHMIDVKVLYLTFEKIMYLLLVMSVIGLGYMAFKDKIGFIGNLAKGFNFALIVTGILCAVLTIIFTVGFNTFWTTFHEIMFTNDLWLLDPKISTMINMFPLNFWLAMCTDALKQFAITFFILDTAVNFVSRRKAG